ncbi:Tripartite tricarboxylate transporter family receptor [Pigmentiphaga humi]|uniref:Tripartite tricarboxylate transporter family receptor n=1 Tax=Pigmentiphaga humi TaxID=2478468 RepID=A0A3P4BAA5_9BURK|nr:tripartite tricarboxylate transporter substrate binding protein [Pigmentiphaga humi]VCU72065.1 Tripartite tricarboxylate transporter family receptor [Pigmentiphaga humi]
MQALLSTLGLAAGVLLAAAPPAQASDYPTRPIRLVVPFPAGGGVDAVARALSKELGATLGTTIVVDNRGGAGGAVGTSDVARSAPDGYTLLLTTNGHSILPHIQRTDWDPIKDFSPVSQVAVLPMAILVNARSPITSLPDLIATAKQAPGKLSYASSGIGGPFHLGMEMFKNMAGIDILHVPYKGNAPMATALLGGEVQMSMDTLAVSLPQVKAGKFRAVAVTSGHRLRLLPGVPTVGESGVPGYEYQGWQGVLAPAGTPPDIVAKLNAALVQVIAMPRVNEQLEQLGFEPQSSSTAEFAGLISSDLEKYGKVIRTTNIKAQ